MKGLIAGALMLVSLYCHATPVRSCDYYKEHYACKNNANYKVHLTFDDGPVVTNTDKVLAALAEYDVPASFFVVADRLGNGQPPEHARIIRRIQQAGHPIASHSYHHHHHTQLSQSDLQTYVEKARTHAHDWEVDAEPLGDYLSRPLMFRLPYGDGWHPLTTVPNRSDEVMEALQSQGFSHMGWDIHGFDWDRARQRSPGVLHYLLKGICKEEGGIILLHDLQDNTADNIGEWIKAMKCLGHTFGPQRDFLQTNDVVQMCPGVEIDDASGGLRQNIEEIVPHVE